MPPEDLLDFVRKRPCVPFRIHVSDGTIYEIRHPELAMIGVESAVIGLPSDTKEELYRRTETVALSHVVRLEPIGSGAASS